MCLRVLYVEMGDFSNKIESQSIITRHAHLFFSVGVYMIHRQTDWGARQNNTRTLFDRIECIFKWILFIYKKYALKTRSHTSIQSKLVQTVITRLHHINLVRQGPCTYITRTRQKKQTQENFQIYFTKSDLMTKMDAVVLVSRHNNTTHTIGR